LAGTSPAIKPATKPYHDASHKSAAAFPNWEGTEQKRIAAITSDESKWTIPMASIELGGSNGRRAKSAEKALRVVSPTRA
jgi:hypothetical protein